MPSWLKPSDLRELVTARWGHPSKLRCAYCGRSAPDGAVDHFIPRNRGGTDLPWNLVPSCPVCNRSKADHAPVLWMKAVGIPDSTISTLQTITRTPVWNAAAAGYRPPSLVAPQYADAFGLYSPAGPQGLPLNLAEVYVLDPDSWSPTTALRRIAADYLADIGRPPLSTQQLNKLLRARGLVQTRRKGVQGYRGFQTVPEVAGGFAAGRAATKSARQLESLRYGIADETARLTD